jgi:hypothetical protein
MENYMVLRASDTVAHYILKEPHRHSLGVILINFLRRNDACSRSGFQFYVKACKLKQTATSQKQGVVFRF